MHSFTFDGANSREYCKLFVSGGDTYNAPERDIESIPVPGRNGELTIDHGRYKNIKVEYSGWIMENVNTNMLKARNWLCSKIGYKRLEDDYNTDTFRMARIVDGVSFSLTSTFPQAALTKIQFDCMPQRWLKSGETEIVKNSTGTSISNPTLFPAKPLITVFGTGEGTITVGGKKVSISDIGGSIVLDSEIERAYSGSTPKDDKITITNGYPTIPGGSSTVKFTGGVTKVSIIPRWWRL